MFCAKGNYQGKINARGYFQFKDYATSLDYLDMVKRSHIDGNTCFYFKVINKSTGKKNIVVVTLENRYVKNNIKRFSSLRNGLIVTKDIPELAANRLDDFVYNEIMKLSDDDFYKKYVTETGALIPDKNLEIDKAVTYRILKSNIPLILHGLSGEWALQANSMGW